MRLQGIDLDHHARLRSIVRTFHNGIIASLSRKSLISAAERLGVYDEPYFTVQNDFELRIVYDYCIYSRNRSGGNIVKTRLKNLPDTIDFDESAVRDAMLADRFSVFRIDEMLPDHGFLLNDLVHGDRLYLVDSDLAEEPLGLGACICGRVLPLPDYWTGAGAFFPATDEILDDVEIAFAPLRQLHDAAEVKWPQRALQDFTTAVVACGLLADMPA